MILSAESFIAFLISMGVRLWMDTSSERPPVEDAYDFIVIGAGPGGAAVASRLSENPKFSVLLLEAGGESNSFTDIPYLGYRFAATPMSYRYVTESTSEFGWALMNNQSVWVGGKATGGSTMHNGMVANRGDPASFEKWCKKEGAHGWCYKDVLPYFKKMESYTNLAADLKFRGKDGPIRIEDLPYRTPIAETFLRAAAANGIPIGDYNGPRRQVASLYQMTSDRGSRVTASNAYLRERNRPNLRVLTFAKAEKLMIQRREGKLEAVGVYFEFNKKLLTVFATKEIILSAGAIESPKLLMLSGIGPQDCLKEARIPVIKELPVGLNMIDHAVVNLVFNLNKNGNFTQNDVRDFTNENWNRYLNGDRGPLSLAGAEQAVIHLRSSPDAEEADIQLELANSNTLNGGSKQAWMELFNGRPEIWDQIFQRDFGKNQISFHLYLTALRGRGRVKLNATEPMGPPLIGGRGLRDPHDIGLVLNSVKLAHKLSKFTEFKKYGMEPVFYSYPGCENLSGDSAILCYVLATMSNSVHIHGTCKMGPLHNSVVDPQLRVYGVKGLRIADISVAPASHTGNTQLLSYLVGERAADFIKQEW